jgi:hypothetical protein
MSNIQNSHLCCGEDANCCTSSCLRIIGILKSSHTDVVVFSILFLEL